MADLEDDDPREDHYAQSIADRDSWLRSFGMTPYTTSDKFMAKINKENIESRRIHGMPSLINHHSQNKILTEQSVDDLPPCEKIPGKLTADFKEHLDSLKQ
jgi:hypothetical protein